MKTSALLHLVICGFFCWNAAVVASPEQNAELKEALSRVLSCDCGNSAETAVLQRQSKLIHDAGPKIVPLLAELVVEPSMSPWFVGNAARTACQYPFVEEMRNAVRLRRSDPSFEHDPGGLFGIFDYFVLFGDHSDLTWMENAVTSLSEERRPRVLVRIKKLQERLNKK
jgi:hypothetical protein